MALKTFKPTTPARRQLVIVDRSELWKGKPVKALTEGMRKTGGRNNHGRITDAQRGGGHKRRYRIDRFQAPQVRRAGDGRAARIRSEPHRLHRADPLRGRRAQPTSWRRSACSAGDKVVSGERVDIKPGNAMPLKSIPVGTIIHNVEMKPGKGGQIARAAGTYVQLVGRDTGYALLRLASGEVRMVRCECLATIGAVSNPDQQNIVIGKAGRNRWSGIRPAVRGVAMNPVDHPAWRRRRPTSGGTHPVTPWGKPTKGKKTRHNKGTDGMIMRRRHAAK